MAGQQRQHHLFLSLVEGEFRCADGDCTCWFPGWRSMMLDSFGRIPLRAKNRGFVLLLDLAFDLKQEYVELL